MATVQTPQRRAAGNGSAPAGLRLTRSRERRTPWVVLGVMIIAGSALAFATWSSSLGHRDLVVVAARDVKQGATLTADDVRAARVAFDGRVRTVPADDLHSLVGQVAAAPLARGAVLHPSQLRDGPGDTAVVGAALAPGAIPTVTLHVGDRVQVVEVSGPSAGERSDGGRVLVTAEVVALRELDDAAHTVVVSLRVPVDDVARVANAAAGNRIRLGLLEDAEQ